MIIRNHLHFLKNSLIPNKRNVWTPYQLFLDKKMEKFKVDESKFGGVCFQGLQFNGHY